MTFSNIFGLLANYSSVINVELCEQQPANNRDERCRVHGYFYRDSKKAFVASSCDIAMASL